MGSFIFPIILFVLSMIIGIIGIGMANKDKNIKCPIKGEIGLSNGLLLLSISLCIVSIIFVVVLSFV